MLPISISASSHQVASYSQYFESLTVPGLVNLLHFVPSIHGTTHLYPLVHRLGSLVCRILLVVAYDDDREHDHEQ